MNLTLSEAIDCLHKWEKKETQINVLLVPHSQEFKVSTSGRVRTDGGNFTVTHEAGCELRIAITEDMRFKYNDAILEIRAPLWRCVLHEPKD